jgi:hypothetical protein
MAPPDLPQREVSFLTQRSPERTRTVTASVYGGNLVFNDGTYYPPLAGSESREVDHYAAVAKEHKPLLLQALLQEHPEEPPEPAGGSPELSIDQQLLLALATYAQRGEFLSLVEIEDWLTAHQVPFEHSSWIDID